MVLSRQMFTHYLISLNLILLYCAFIRSAIGINPNNDNNPFNGQLHLDLDLNDEFFYRNYHKSPVVNNTAIDQLMFTHNIPGLSLKVVQNTDENQFLTLF